MLETLFAFVIGYLKLAAIFVPVAAAIVVYDTRMYPICSECHDNMHTRRPKLFNKLAKCQLHGRIAA